MTRTGIVETVPGYRCAPGPPLLHNHSQIDTRAPRDSFLCEIVLLRSQMRGTPDYTLPSPVSQKLSAASRDLYLCDVRARCPACCSCGAPLHLGHCIHCITEITHTASLTQRILHHRHYIYCIPKLHILRHRPLYTASRTLQSCKAKNTNIKTSMRAS